jgi:hypothetical protein
VRVKLDRSQILRLLDGYPIQVATEVGLLEFEATQTEWQPLVQRGVPGHIIEHHEGLGMAAPVDLWANDIYEVMIYDAREEDAPPGSGITWLSIKRYDRAPIRNWRHFQQIKNEVCGPEREAVELFPSEARVADNANQYHLWVFPEGMPIPFGFPTGMVLVRDDEVEAWNRQGGPGRQEPMQPGVTVGRAMDEARTAENDDQMRQLIRTLNPAKS